MKIGDRIVTVDSHLEERVLRKLDENGFRGLWAKPSIGINVNRSNYTPDIELSVQLDGMTHRAVVEIKPAANFFTPYICRRMIGIARHYHTKLLLLYAEKEDSWYRIDCKTGVLSQCGAPVPGNIPIKKLYKPLSIPAAKVYSHYYDKAALPALGKALMSFIIEALLAPFITPKRRRRGHNYRRRRRR